MANRRNILIGLILSIPLIYYAIMRTISKWSITYQEIDKIRECDGMGCGHYGAPRGNRTHKGIDILAEVGTYIFAPFRCYISKLSGQVYAGTNHYRYVEIKGLGIYRMFTMRLFYLDQVFTGTLNQILTNHEGKKLLKGATIGVVQDIASHHGGGMGNHVHVELKIFGIQVNPTPFFNLV